MSAANPLFSTLTSSSRSPHCSLLRLLFSSFLPLFSGRSSAKSEPLRLLSVCCQGPNSSSGSVLGGTDGFVSDVSDSSSSSPPASPAIDFLTLCRCLKTTKRKGWIKHRIEDPESIADDMYRMSLMAMIAGDIPGLDRVRCIKIAIMHDIAEAIVGDITPFDGVPRGEKSQRELVALNEMCEVLGGGLRAEEI